ncbi:MAG: hypothetical protein V3T03_01255, partial [Candidatus Bipolaricaulota bacterium]
MFFSNPVLKRLALAFGLVVILGIGAMAAGTFRVAMQPPTRIDPAIIDSDSEIAIANAVYDYLVDIDANNAVIAR